MVEDTPAAAQRRFPVRKVAIGIGAAVAGLILLVALLIVGLNTGPGHRFIISRLDSFSTASGMNFRVRSIEGSLYGRMTLIGFEVRDEKGAFVTSPALTVDWRPFDYIRSKIDVRELSAGEVRLIRAPQFKPVPSDPNAPILPDIDLSLAKVKVDRFIFEPAITGRRHIVRLDGRVTLADRRAQMHVDAAALRAPGVAGGDKLTLTIDAVPAIDLLVIKGNLAAPVGGLVDSYAKLGKPLTLSVDGSGDWGRWDGKVVSLLGGQPLTDLTLSARKGTVTVKGPLRPGLMLSGPAARMVEPAIDLDARAVLDKRKANVQVAMRSSAFNANMAGLIDLGVSRFGALTIKTNLLTPGVIAPNLAGKDVQAVAVLDGPIARPSVDYRISATSLAFGTMGVEGLMAEGKAQVNTDRIAVPVHAFAKRVTGLNAAAGGLLTNVRVDGDLAYSNAKILSDNLRLRSDKIDATAIILVDPAKGTYTGALKGRVNDYQVDGIGRISLVTDAKLITGPRGGFGIAGWVHANTKRLDNASIRDFLGGNALVTAKVGYDENGVASVRDLMIAAPKFRVAGGSGSYRTSDGRIMANLREQSTDYGPFTLVTTGTLARPLVKLHADRPNMGVGLANLDATVEGSKAGYRLRGKADSAYGPVVADVTVGTGRGPLTFDIAQARFAGIQFGGRLVQLPSGPFGGTITLAGSGLNGTVRLGAERKFQRADVDIRAAAAHIPGANPITIGSGTITGTAIFFNDGPSVTGQFGLTDIRQGSFFLARAQGRANYAYQRGSVALISNGRSTVPFGLAMQAQMAPGRIAVNAKGEVNAIAFRLNHPAILTQQHGNWVLGETDIVLPQGSVGLSGSYGKAIEGRAALHNLDLSIIEAFVPGLGIGGKATGLVTATMPPGGAIPTMNARVDIAGFTRTSALVVSEPVDVATLATLSNAGGDFRAIVRRSGAIVGRAQVRLTPIPASGGDWSTRLMAAPLSGGLRYNGPADVLWTLSGIAQQQLTGPIAIAADFGGRLNEPTLNGIMRANALRYENDVYGSVISNIAIDGRFTQSQLVVNSLTGRAGSGTISAKGSVGFAATSGFPIDISATLDNARLAKSDALGATVTGTLHVTNSKANGALIQGDLTIPNARYEIIRQGAAEVPELTGIRRKNAAAGPPPPPSQVPSNWKLDIHVRAPNQLFVSGMGLEAEWSTDMRISGTASNPIVVGRLDVVRGTYSFSGRRFEISDDSHVTFNGSMTNPELAISASTTVTGVSAIINIGGYAQAPQITFTSTPTLPQDEVLSRLLFGTSVTSLSPTQALQLAAALNSLRGSGGGLNPLGKLRSATGLDRLRVLGSDKDAGHGTALAAGKYISNNIYVEVVTDARGFTQTQLEISLSKALSLLSATGSFGGSSVNLRYSKDY